MVIKTSKLEILFFSKNPTRQYQSRINMASSQAFSMEKTVLFVKCWFATATQTRRQVEKRIVPFVSSFSFDRSTKMICMRIWLKCIVVWNCCATRKLAHFIIYKIKKKVFSFIYFVLIYLHQSLLSVLFSVSPLQCFRVFVSHACLLFITFLMLAFVFLFNNRVHAFN